MSDFRLEFGPFELMAQLEAVAGAFPDTFIGVLVS
jgi:hypothetical protein